MNIPGSVTSGSVDICRISADMPVILHVLHTSNFRGSISKTIGLPRTIDKQLTRKVAKKPRTSKPV
jgi:hypothetical protein